MTSFEQPAISSKNNTLIVLGLAEHVIWSQRKTTPTEIEIVFT
jgi:hypothetical protein